MIKREDILSLSYLKKSPFTGSFQGMRYRLEQQKEGENQSLKTVVWESPYSFETTPEEKKEWKEFSFSEEGIQEAVDWMNRKWESQQERWREAKNHW